jgi:hypothetical protein
MSGSLPAFPRLFIWCQSILTENPSWPERLRYQVADMFQEWLPFLAFGDSPDGFFPFASPERALMQFPFWSPSDTGLFLSHGAWLESNPQSFSRLPATV